MHIPIEKLLAVRTIVAHKNAEVPCPDGVASALILRDALPDAEVRFASHVDLEKADLPASGVLFCDVSPPARRAPELAAQGAILLDHHATARDAVAAFGPFGVYADATAEPGVSGAMLAYREVWAPIHGSGRAIEMFAHLVGVRDTWQKESHDFRHACEQAAALAFWPWSMWPVEPFDDGDRLNPLMLSRLDIGPVLFQQKLERADALARDGYRFATRAGRFLVVSSVETSDAAESQWALDVDAVIGFAYGVRDFSPHMQLSLRSRTGYDVGAFCKRHGGGGHKAAAGCHVQIAPDAANPYEFIRSLVEADEDKAREERHQQHIADARARKAGGAK